MAVDAISKYVVQCIRQRRIEQGMRVQDMAKRTGIPLGSYSCLETGRYRMSLENLFRILAVLGVEIQEVWPSRLKQRQIKKVTSRFIRRVVDNAEKRRPRLIGYEDILGAVCKVYGVSRKKLCSPSRRRDLAEARTVATALVKEQRHLKLVELSRLLKRDVSSLSHCLRRLHWRLDYDKGLKGRLREARQQVATAIARPSSAGT